MDITNIFLGALVGITIVMLPAIHKVLLEIRTELRTMNFREQMRRDNKRLPHQWLDDLPLS